MRIRRQAVAESCVDVLDGRVAERLERRRQPIPPWAWMNLLAHGTEDEIRQAAVGPLALTGWRRARAVVASAIVDLLDQGTWTLPELQRTVLVPFELHVIRFPGRHSPSPEQLFASLLWTLEIQASDRSER
jgi:hypothetical protein